MSATDLATRAKQSRGALQRAEANATGTATKAEAAWNHARQTKLKLKQLKKVFKDAKKAAKRADEEADAARKAFKKARKKAAKAEKALRKDQGKMDERKPAKPIPSLWSKKSQSLVKPTGKPKPLPKQKTAPQSKPVRKTGPLDVDAHGTEAEMTSVTLPPAASFDPTSA